MGTRGHVPTDPVALRRKAEQRFAERRGASIPRKASAADIRRLVQELQVHQIELEMQNEELERLRAEVEEALARYSDLYEFAPVGYLTLGRDGEIRQVNLTGTRLLRLERARLVGTRFGLLLGIESRIVLSGFLVRVFESGIKQSCELLLQPEGETATSVELTASASQVETECRAILADITERTQRRRAEHERQQLELQLAHAQKMETVGTLAGGIAHDFNNILGGILGGLSVLELDCNEQHSEIEEMKALVERGADLTRQLLGFARRGKYDVKPLDLVRVAKETSAMFGRTRKDIRIEHEFASELRPVLMDRTQLEQVLLNLFINAGQAMPEGGQLHLSARNVELSAERAAPHNVAAGHFVELVVTDTGVGMDAATGARIFEPFFTTKEPGEGTGLGLASVYGILKNHGGFIAFESEPGQGTSFTLSLPATDQPIAHVSGKLASIKRGTGTILVVDDEKMITKVCASMLERMGYDVLTASNGRQAIELVRQHGAKIALVILDLIMPGISGRDTYTALREIAPDIKVLLSSGYSAEGQAQEILERGGNGFIQKPYDAASLSAKLSEIL